MSILSLDCQPIIIEILFVLKELTESNLNNVLTKYELNTLKWRIISKLYIDKS